MNNSKQLVIKDLIDELSKSNFSFDLEKLQELIEYAQTNPKSPDELKGNKTKVNLIELVLIRMHFPYYDSKQLQNYFGVHNVNIRKQIIKYKLDDASIIDGIKETVNRMSLLPMHAEMGISVDLHQEAQDEIHILNVAIKRLRDPLTGMLKKEYLDSKDRNYYIDELCRLEKRKETLLKSVGDIRSKALRYFDHTRFLSFVYKVVTKQAGIGAAQAILSEIENYSEIFQFGIAKPLLPEDTE
jgi:hypothetical protein